MMPCWTVGAYPGTMPLMPSILEGFEVLRICLLQLMSVKLRARLEELWLLRKKVEPGLEQIELVF